MSGLLHRTLMAGVLLLFSSLSPAPVHAYGQGSNGPPTSPQGAPAKGNSTLPPTAPSVLRQAEPTNSVPRCPLLCRQRLGSSLPRRLFAKRRG